MYRSKKGNGYQLGGIADGGLVQVVVVEVMIRGQVLVVF